MLRQNISPSVPNDIRIYRLRLSKHRGNKQTVLKFIFRQRAIRRVEKDERQKAIEETKVELSILVKI